VELSSIAMGDACKDAAFVPSPANISQQVEMIETFSELTTSENAGRRAGYGNASFQTQEHLNSIWVAARS
jgi:hypothetical protein